MKDLTTENRIKMASENFFFSPPEGHRDVKNIDVPN